MAESLQKERLQRLQQAALEGDVDALFSILAEDALVLERFDDKAFESTPLHKAVSGGKIHFAKEIVNLKPSFAEKRDHLGRSPLHLALELNHQELKERNPPPLALEEKYQEMEGREGKYQELVTWLINVNSKLVRVTSKGMVTPLHYAAQLNDETNLADFLYVCPSSIHDLTVKCETVVHVAIKNGSCRALKALLGCLQHFSKEAILTWEDEEGNNALHTAISENRIEVVEPLIKNMGVNKKNRQGLTALDIFYSRQNWPNPGVERILLDYKAKRASEVAAHSWFISRLLKLFGFENSPVKYFSGKLSLAKRFLKSFGVVDHSQKNVTLEVRNILLVVATLITTTTYQAALSPPGGYWQDDKNLPAKNTFIDKNTNITSILAGKEPSQQRTGHMILGSLWHLSFLLCNYVAFVASVYSITSLTSGLPFSKLITLPITLIQSSFLIAVIETFPYSDEAALTWTALLSVFVIPTVIFLCPYLVGLEVRKLKWCGQGKKLRPGSL